METIQKGFKFVLILIVSLTFSNCTAWPALSALFMQSSSGGGGILPLIPGSSSSSPPPAVTPTDTSGSATIQFSTSSSSNLETSPNVTIPVTISSAKDATVTYTVTGTATGGGIDYTLANGTITFTSGGAMTQNITFSVVNDALKETNETVIITLSNPSSSATLGTNTVHTYTITDDDSSTIAFTATSSTAGEGTTAVSIPVSISSTSAATVDYSVTGGTATGSGTDYTLASGTLTFTDGGATTQNITFIVVDEALYELDETIIITLTNSTGANLGTNTVHTYTITNDDAMPIVAFTATSSSGAESVTAPTITVTLSGASALATTVDYAASGTSSASGGSDYTLAAGTLTFAAGTTSQTIPLTIVNDLNTELNETVIVILSNALNATLGTSSHIYTIEDNDPPAISFDVTSSNGSEATTNITIPVSLNAPYAGAVTVDYSVTGGTATAGGTDFTLANGTLTFASGISSQNITATIVNDAAFESNETFIVTLSNPTSGASLGGNVNHTYTINDDDAPSIAFAATTSNGSEATTAVNIPVSISMTATASVNYAVTGGTATGADYTLASGTLNFTNGGATTQNISLTVNNDALNEADETIIITLSSPSSGINLGVNTTHTYTITNDDAAPTIAFAAATSGSTDETAANRTIAINLSAASGQAVSVVVTDLGTGSATSGTDYTAIGSPLTVNFAAGETTKNVTIPVLADTTDENDETINFQLSSPSNATLGGQTTHAFSIIDDDAAPSFSISSPSVNEGNTGTANLTYTVTLSAVSGKTVTVDYATSNGTATTADTDYTAITTTTLTFTPGQTSKTIDVVVNGDTKNEVNETVVVTLATPVNATIGTGTGTGTITNDDTAPTVAFTATTSNGAENTAGTVNIPVTLAGNATSQTVTVDYAVTGTATGGGTDYTLANGTLTFNAGTTSQNISVVVVNDGLNESNETVIVTLSNATIASLGTNTVHTFTIIDDDTPSITFDAATSSGSEGTASFNIPVTMAISATASVNYSVTGGNATGADFTLAAGTLSWTAESGTKNIVVTINNDTLDELDETIVITLASPTSANLGAITAHTFTITDNDNAPTVAFGAATSGSTDETAANRTIAINLSAASGQAVSVVVTDLETGSATSGTDYTAIGSPLTVNFAAGETTKNVTIPVLADTTDENDETINFQLSSPSNATLGGQTTHAFSIIDDDAAPSFSISSPSVNEGNTGTANLTYTVTLSAVSGKTVTVDYATSNGTATTADTDYTAITTTTLTFTPGQTSKTIDVVINGDTKNEVNETVVVTLVTPVNATIGTGTGTGTGTITNDDTAPTVAFGAATSDSTNETATGRTIAVNLSAASGQAISVVVTDGGGLATSGTDYTAIGSPLTVNFAAGETTKNVTIPVLSDTLDEENETVVLTLSSPNNATLGAQTTHTFSIIDDDATPTVQFTSASQISAGETGTMTITAQLSAASGLAVSVPFTLGGNATLTSDYTISASPLSIAAGSTTATITITIATDALPEANETVIVNMGTPTNATASGTTTHTATIRDDDSPTVQFTAASQASVGESGTMTITAQLSATSGVDVSVPFTLGGNATLTSDYTISASPLTITAGQTTATITITITADTTDEPNETIVVNMGTPTNANASGTTTHTATITDDDNGPTVAFTATTSNGGEATTAVTIPVTLAAASGQTVTVGYSVTGGTATSGGTDFTLLGTGTLTFNPGVTSQDVSVTVVNDGTTEVDETIIITLASPTNSTLGTNTVHTYTINDNDPPTVAFTTTASNATEATTAVTIPVTLSAAYSQTVTVGYSVTGGTATSGGTDFTLGGTGTLTFAAGVTSQDVSITVVNDTATELNETIVVTLASPTVATLGTNTVHTYTINDNDPPTVAFSTTASNASETTTAVTIPVTLSAAYANTVTVDYSVTGGTATSGGTDYTITAGTLTFTTGVTSQNISITVNNDVLDEANETIIITLANPGVATLGTNTVHTYTIDDDDAAPTVQFSAATSASTNESQVNTDINLTLSAASGQTISVVVTDAGGTATSGTDYMGIGSPLTIYFNAGETSKPVTIGVLQDTIFEPGGRLLC